MIVFVAASRKSGTRDAFCFAHPLQRPPPYVGGYVVHGKGCFAFALSGSQPLVSPIRGLRRHPNYLPLRKVARAGSGCSCGGSAGVESQ